MSVQLAARSLLVAMLVLAGCWISHSVCEAAEDNPWQIAECQYACGAGGMDLKTLHECGVTLVSHVDWTLDAEPMKQYLAEAHKLGIKLLPYVSPEKAWFMDTPERLRQFHRRNSRAAIPYYQAVDPSAHREWILIDKLGRPAPRYGSYVNSDAGEWELKWGIWEVHGQKYQDHDNPNPWSWYMCSSAEGYIDAVERGVRASMDMGFDGVFLDNTSTKRLALCHGAELQKHKHRPPGHNTDKTYQELAERVYETVKSYGPEKIVLLNGGREDAYEPIRNGAMIESYICTGGARERIHKWEQVLKWARQFRDERKHGRVVTALSYLGSSRYPPKDDCFYTYACAQLSGFKWTASSPRKDVVRLLYRARLIVPQGELESREGLWYRHYDRGIVVVNPVSGSKAEGSIPLPADIGTPVDLYTGQRLPVADGKVAISVAAESGRVVVEAADALDNYVSECATILSRDARGRDDGLAKELRSAVSARKESPGAPADRRLLDVLTKVQSWRRRLPASGDRRYGRLRIAGKYAASAAGLLEK